MRRRTPQSVFLQKNRQEDNTTPLFHTISRRTGALLLLVSLVLIAAIPPAQARGLPAQGGCTATPRDRDVNMRAGPDETLYSVTGVLRSGQAAPVVGRSADGAWIVVRAPDSIMAQEVEGWVAARVITLADACRALPVIDPPGEPPDYAPLMAVPALPDQLDPRLRDVFARGQAAGRDPRAFTRAGDCNTESDYFLTAFDSGDYDLGPYTALEPAVEFFAGWWAHASLAGQTGFNALTMLEPLWADPQMCQPGEGPLACELRRTQASVIVIMFGPNDMLNLTPEQFETAARQIVALALDQGVIPVLTTFTWHRDTRWAHALQLNRIVVTIAEENGLPLINFWRAAQALPNYGLVQDYTHLTPGSAWGYRIAFDGTESESGYALRNLLTLQLLDHLRREVLAG